MFLHDRSVFPFHGLRLEILSSISYFRYAFTVLL
jgi:hypothetical protein